MNVIKYVEAKFIKEKIPALPENKNSYEINISESVAKDFAELFTKNEFEQMGITSIRNKPDTQEYVVKIFSRQRYENWQKSAPFASNVRLFKPAASSVSRTPSMKRKRTERRL